jgi:clan AA aspartic protease
VGVFAVNVEIGDPRAENFQPVEALVDTGASYTELPASALRALGVTAKERRPFVHADGRTVELEVGQTWIRIDGRTEMTIVVFAEEGTQPVLGAMTLEEFGLGIDPVGRKLIPVPGYRLAARRVA